MADAVLQTLGVRIAALVVAALLLPIANHCTWLVALGEVAYVLIVILFPVAVCPSNGDSVAKLHSLDFEVHEALVPTEVEHAVTNHQPWS